MDDVQADRLPDVLLRYRYRDGTLQAALPMRTVQDDDAVVVAWLSPGTRIMYWALSDGRDPRSIAVDQRFLQRLTTAPRTWQGGGVLHVLPAGQPFQVLHFWGSDGHFARWYVNFEAPSVRSGNTIDTVDWHLDLIIETDLTWRWKDEDEAEAALAAGHLAPADLATARAAGQAVLNDLPSWLQLVGDWRTFRPPSSWAEPLDLPADWDR